MTSEEKRLIADCRIMVIGAQAEIPVHGFWEKC